MKIFKKFKLPIIMQLISPYIFILSLSILIFALTNRVMFYEIGFDAQSSWNKPFILFSILVGGSNFFIIFTMIIDYLIKYIKFLNKKDKLMKCNNCNKSLYDTGYKKEYIDMSNVKFVCLRCKNEMYRKGLF